MPTLEGTSSRRELMFIHFSPRYSMIQGCYSIYSMLQHHLSAERASLDHTYIESPPRLLRGPILLQAGEVHQQHREICARREGHVLWHRKEALRGRDPSSSPDVPLCRGHASGIQIFTRRWEQAGSPILQVRPQPAHSKAEGADRAKILTKVLFIISHNWRRNKFQLSAEQPV